MKFFTLFLTLLSINAAQAVVTKNCPESISFKYQKMDLLDRRFLIVEINALKDKGFLQGKLRLTYSHNAKCEYRGENELGEYISAQLEGSTRTNAKKKAQLKIYHRDYISYIKIQKVTKAGLIAKDNFSSMYVYGEYCSWGDCIPNYYPIGTAQKVKLQ